MRRGLDTETALISPGNFAPRHVVTSSYRDTVPSQVELSKEPDLITDEEVVGANIAYDMWVWIKAGLITLDQVIELYESDRVLDVQIREKLLQISRGELHRYKYSLGDLAERYLGQVLDKSADSWRLRYEELIDIPIDQWPPEARDYAEQDAVTPVKISYMQPDRQPSEALITKRAFVLQGMTVRGLEIDQVLLKDLTKEMDELEEVHLTALLDQGLLKVNLKNKCGYSKNMKEIQARISRGYGGRPPRTPKGKVSTSAETLAGLEGFDELQHLIGFGYAGKMKTTYLESMDGPVINASYDPCLATGRTSAWGPSKKSNMFAEGVRGTNVQNLPKKAKHRSKGDHRPWIRDLIIAGEGQKFCVVDWSAMELRVLGQVCLDLFGRSDIAQGFIDDPDWDSHIWMAAKRNDQEFPERGSSDWTQFHHRERELSKIQVYGCMGGMGGQTLFENARRNGSDATLDECMALAHSYKSGAVFREIPQFFAYVEAHEGLPTPAGRLGRIRGGGSYCQTANTQFQGPASDVLSAALWELVREPIVMEVHDEIVGRTTTEDAPRLLDRIVWAMTESPSVLELIPDVPLRCANPVIVDRFGEAK